MGGGLPRGSCILLHGGPGSGKTTFAIEFLYNDVVQSGEAFLDDQGLIQRIEGKDKRFTMTERGREVIKYFDEVETSLFYKKKTFSNINIHYAR